MARIPTTPSPKTFAETFSSDLKKAVTTAAGKDGRLSANEAKKMSLSTTDDRAFADNAQNFLKATGQKSVGVNALADSAKAYAQRAAETAAGPAGKLSLADGKKLPADLQEDFFMFRGQAMTEAKLALDAATTDLLMPSETDATFKFLTGKQLNGAPITEQVIREQLSAQHDALLPQVMFVSPDRVALKNRTPVEVRSFDDFMNRLATNVDPNDPDSIARGQKFANLKAALSSKLTDLTVMRFNTIDISTFIVGRTKNGELAGLLTGQVET